MPELGFPTPLTFATDWRWANEDAETLFFFNKKAAKSHVIVGGGGGGNMSLKH